MRIDRDRRVKSFNRFQILKVTFFREVETHVITRVAKGPSSDRFKNDFETATVTVLTPSYRARTETALDHHNTILRTPIVDIKRRRRTAQTHETIKRFFFFINTVSASVHIGPRVRERLVQNFRF